MATLAFISADVAHEAVGHGGMCLALGSHVTQLSSVYFHCANGGPLTDAGGPLMNLLVGMLCWGCLRLAKPASPHWHILWVLAMAFNLFWGSGYFIFSAVTDGGDWAFVLRDLGWRPAWLWRTLMGVLGLGLYYQTLRLLARGLPGNVPLLVPYLAAGVVSCLTVLCYAGPVLPALREAAQESFGAAIGLLLLRWARRAARPAATGQVRPLTGDVRWLAAAAGAWGVFAATLGHGFGMH